MIRLCFVFILMLLVAPAQAVIWGGDSQSWDFQAWVTREGCNCTTTSLSNKATQRYLRPIIEETILAEIKPDITRTSDGLVLSAVGTTIVLDSYHVGMDNRPLSKLGLDACLAGTQLDHENFTLSWRYSTNEELWSDWSSMEYIDHVEDQVVQFRGKLEVPTEHKEVYRKHWDQWAYVMKNWHGDNADEYYAYVQQTDPKILKRCIPLIRYVQVRVEWYEGSEAILKSICTYSGWIVSGLKQ